MHRGTEQQGRPGVGHCPWPVARGLWAVGRGPWPVDSAYQPPFLPFFFFLLRLSDADFVVLTFPFGYSSKARRY